jgi:hypothetical protein
MPAFITAALAAVTWETVASFVIKTILSYAISSLLSPKQKNNAASTTPLSDAAQTQTLTIAQAAPNWEIVYGEVRKGGKYLFRHVTQQNENQQLTEMHTVPSTAPYTVTVAQAGTFAANVSVEEVSVVTGSDDQQRYEYDPFAAVSGAPAVLEYSYAAGVYTFNAADAGRSLRFTYTANSGPVKAKWLHLVIALAAHECEEIGDIYFDDEVVPLDGSGYATGKYLNHVLVTKHLGTTTQTADTALLGQLSASGVWSEDHRLRGHAYIYVRLLKNNDLFPGGVPNISAMVKGKKVYDPRSTLTVWSDNAALCVADYMNSAVGLNAAYADEIADAELIAAANVCDESVTLASGASEARYTCNGVVDTGDKPGEIIGRMLGALAGRAVYVNGTWKIHAGAYVAPTVTFDEGDFRGPIQMATRLSRRDTFNGVKGVYVSPDNSWQPADFPALASATYMAEDNNERIWKDIELPFTTSSSMAQRLAKIELLRARQQITVHAPLKMSAYKAEPPETIGLTFTKFGWTAKAFDIAELRLIFGEAPGVDLSLRETASNVYDWSASEESTVDAAPNTNLPNPFVVLAPGVPSVTETLYELFGFGVKVKATVSWAASSDAQARRYDLQWKKRTDTVWNENAGLETLTADVLDVEADTYLFRVRAINALGVSSLWSQVEKTFVGLTAAPGDVAGFSIIKSAGFALAQWTLADDLDVRIGGSIVIRHSPLTSGAAWQNGIIVGEENGAAVQRTVPLITGTYMAKFVDSSGNLSLNETTFVATEGLVTGFSTVGTSTQATAFTGSKTNVALDTALGGIKLDSTTLIDSMVTSIDDWNFLDSIGGISATGSYAFDTYLDLTTVLTRRFEADITALSYDTGDLIDSRLDNIDDWDSLDSDTINDCNVTLYARTTDTDPAGSPTWTSWMPFMVADFTCRAAQFKLDFVSGNSTHNIAVTQLTVHAKVPV